MLTFEQHRSHRSSDGLFFPSNNSSPSYAVPPHITLGENKTFVDRGGGSE